MRLRPAVFFLSLLAAYAAEAQVSIGIRSLVPNGGRVSWYKGPASHDLIAFDAGVAVGELRSEMFSIEPDQSDLFCITCGTSVPQGFVGQPSWHPDGDHLIFQVENANSEGTFHK